MYPDPNVQIILLENRVAASLLDERCKYLFVNCYPLRR